MIQSKIQAEIDLCKKELLLMNPDADQTGWRSRIEALQWVLDTKATEIWQTHNESAIYFDKNISNKEKEQLNFGNWVECRKLILEVLLSYQIRGRRFFTNGGEHRDKMFEDLTLEQLNLWYLLTLLRPHMHPPSWCTQILNYPKGADGTIKIVETWDQYYEEE